MEHFIIVKSRQTKKAEFQAMTNMTGKFNFPAVLLMARNSAFLI